jgi:hypothetical protein
MIRGKRAELPLFEDAIDIPNIPPLDLKSWEVSDVVDFTIRTVDTDEIVARWENPNYKGEDKNENN